MLIVFETLRFLRSWFLIFETFELHNSILRIFFNFNYQFLLCLANGSHINSLPRLIEFVLSIFILDCFALLYFDSANGSCRFTCCRCCLARWGRLDCASAMLIVASLFCYGGQSCIGRSRQCCRLCGVAGAVIWARYVAVVVAIFVVASGAVLV